MNTRSSDQVGVIATRLAIAAAVAQMMLLASLHVLSPEFDPRWRVVSEYALGRYSWVLSLMFVADALSCWALAAALRSHVQTRGARTGLAALVVAGAGPALASVFDLNHPLHEPAGLLGVLGLPAAAMLLGVGLSGSEAGSRAKTVLLWTANLTWISVVVFVISMVVMIVTFLQTGGDMSGSAPTALPAGVIAFVGWANRLILVSGAAWIVTLAWHLSGLGDRSPSRGQTATLAAHARAA